MHFDGVYEVKVLRGHDQPDHRESHRRARRMGEHEELIFGFEGAVENAAARSHRLAELLRGDVYEVMQAELRLRGV